LGYRNLPFSYDTAVIWESDGLVEWLEPYDAFLSISLPVESGGGICEVGVYKGGYLITMLKNNPRLNAVAIDPYPGLNSIKETFLNNLLSYGLEDKIKHFSDYNSLKENLFDLIHIDGEHSESAVIKDLHFARDNLADKGLIVIDDIWHPLFPGVVSATMKFVHESDFVPFLSTRQKMFICRENQYEYHYSQASELLQKFNIPHSSGWMKGSPNHQGVLAAFDQSNAIKGFPQLMVAAKSRHEQLIVLNLTPVTKRIPRKILKQLLPPFLVSVLKKLANQA
jgi:hypothetical protein